MEIALLGPLRVVDDDGGEVVLAGRQQALLAVLAIHVGEIVSTDRLIDALWGEELPDHPNNALQGRVSQLRKAIGRQRVLQRGAGYLLNVPPTTIDARRFETDTSRGHDLLTAGNAAAAQAVLGEALTAWNGPALEEFTGAPWAEAEAHRLEECRLVALEDRIDADLALGASATLVAELDQLVASQPYRERLRGQFMLALYRAGRQADALETFRQGRQLLADELGLEPGSELQRLQSAILTQDPALDAPALDVEAIGTTTTPSAQPAEAVRVLVVDDDPLVRSAVTSILATDPSIEVIGEADDGLAAVEAGRRLAPDVVLMDVRMPELDGIQATRQLLAVDDGMSVIVLTTFDQDEYVVRALEAGASGFLLKRTDPDRLPEAVHTVARGMPSSIRQSPSSFSEPSSRAAVQRLPHLTNGSPVTSRWCSRSWPTVARTQRSRTHSRFPARSSKTGSAASCTSSRCATAPRRSSTPTSTVWCRPERACYSGRSRPPTCWPSGRAG